MRRILFVFFAMFVLVPVHVAARRKPVLTVEKDEYELGQISQHEVQTFTFDVKFWNSGKGKLKIRRVESSCECTTCEFPLKSFRAHRSGKVKVLVDLPQLEKGEIMRSVMIYTDASDEPVVVYFSATIV